MDGTPSFFKMDSLPFLELSIVLMLAVEALHAYLDVRQLRAINRPKPPPYLAAQFDGDKYEKAQAYSRDKMRMGFWQTLYSTSETIVVLAAGGLPWLWARSGDLLQRVGLNGYEAGTTGGEIAQTVVFVIAFSAFSMVTSLPWSVYSTFVVEAKHGFNKQTPALFVTDVVKSALLGLALAPPIVAGMTYILIHSGPMMPYHLWAFVFALSLVMMTIYPTLIAPIFNKFDPLPEGPLRSAIEALAGSLAFPLTRLYQMDGSKRSGHSNAFMYGFLKNKRIVLYDTLIKQCSESEVVAVLAHELGHWKLHHTKILFALGNVLTFADFALLAVVRNTDGLYRSFGFETARPAFVAVLLFAFIRSPLDEALGFGRNVISRLFEYQADGFAVALGHGKDLKAALLKLQEENKGSLHTDAWYSAYHYSHPPVVERLSAIDAALKKTQ